MEIETAEDTKKPIKMHPCRDVGAEAESRGQEDMIEVFEPEEAMSRMTSELRFFPGAAQCERAGHRTRKQ